MTRALREAAREELNKRRRDAARKNLLDFTTYTFGMYKPDPAHRLIAAKLDEVVQGKCKRLMIFAPPQSGKSELASVRLPAFWMAKRPNDPIILCSYGASLAHNKSRQARAIIESQEYAELFPEIKTDRASRAVDHWELAYPNRGGLLAAGVGGPITGNPAVLGLIDDPFENWAQAQSETIRKNIWEWYRTTFRTRVWEGGAIVIIMTRWNEDDICGRLLVDQGSEWEVLRLPAVGETQEDRDKRNEKLGLGAGLPDPLDREPGEALTPSRFSVGALEMLKRDVGILGWEAEYMGCPTLPEGNRIKRQWLQIVDAAPAAVETVWYWDKAGTAEAEGGGAYTSGVKLGGPCESGRYYIMDVIRGQWSALERESTIHQVAETEATLEWDEAGTHYTIAHPGPPIWFEQEPGSGGKESAEATVRNLAGFRAQPDRVTGDKDVRLEPFAVQAEAGNVRLVRGPWNGAFIEELCAVPFGKFRDQADATAGGFNKLAGTKSMKYVQMDWWWACAEQVPELDSGMPVVLALYSGKGEEPTTDACFAAVAVSRHWSDPKNVAVRFCGIWQPAEGQLLDYQSIENEITAFCGRHSVVEVAYLRSQLHDLAQRLRRQGVAHFREFKAESERVRADKRLQDLVLGRRVSHDGNPLLAQHIDAADVEKRGQDGIRIVPRSPRMQVGGAVALSMAADRALYYNLG